MSLPAFATHPTKMCTSSGQYLIVSGVGRSVTLAALETEPASVFCYYSLRGIYQVREESNNPILGRVKAATLQKGYACRVSIRKRVEDNIYKLDQSDTEH